MSWIALTDGQSAAFNIRGLGTPEPPPDAPPVAVVDDILATGTLMIEARFAAGPEAAQPILSFRRNRGWAREIDIAISAEGRLTLHLAQGGMVTHAGLDLPTPRRDSRLRLTYAWHAPQRAGRLTVEALDEGRLYQTAVAAPLPIPIADIKALMRNGRATRLGPEVRYIAVSDGIEPVGLGSGVLAGTRIETPLGPVPVERLRLGDEVITAGSGVQPVRWIARRQVPALGGFRPIRLRAPFFGLARDLVVAPDHRLRLGVAEAEYMFGEDEVLIEAGHLVNLRGVRRDGRARLVTYHQVLLDHHDCLLHDGLWAESLYVGSLARRPDVLAASVLAEMPVSAVPVHRNFARHRLSGFEAKSLAATLHA